MQHILELKHTKYSRECKIDWKFNIFKATENLSSFTLTLKYNITSKLHSCNKKNTQTVAAATTIIPFTCCHQVKAETFVFKPKQLLIIHKTQRTKP